MRAQVVEIRFLNEHLLTECNNKDQFKLCPRCKEAIPTKEYKTHITKKTCQRACRCCSPLCFLMSDGRRGCRGARCVQALPHVPPGRRQARHRPAPAPVRHRLHKQPAQALPARQCALFSRKSRDADGWGAGNRARCRCGCGGCATPLTRTQALRLGLLCLLVLLFFVVGRRRVAVVNRTHHESSLPLCLVGWMLTLRARLALRQRRQQARREAARCP
jgi:hypothetical protein